MVICRLCLQEKSDGISLFLNDELIEKIKDCVSLDVRHKTDPFLSLVCDDCLQKINDWFEFKKMCIKSNEYILHFKRPINRGHNLLVEIRKPEPNEGLKLEAENPLEHTQVLSSVTNNLVPETSNIDHTKNFTHTKEYRTKRGLTIQEFTHTSIGGSPQNDTSKLHGIRNVKSKNLLSTFDCEDCSEEFETSAALTSHKNKHMILCSVCGKLVQKRNFKVHSIKHTDRFKCFECPNRFGSKINLNRHQIAVHTTQKTYVCEICGKRFAFKDSLDSHQKTHSDPQYKCKLCNYEGRSASLLTTHMYTHSTETRSCEICSKVFKSLRHLYNHTKRKHFTEKKHLCQYCDKKFITKYKLRMHLMIHTETRPHECSECGKRFKRLDALKEHERIHGERVLWDCERCGKKWKSRKRQIKHKCVIIQTK